jgi:hypothetical protein
MPFGAPSTPSCLEDLANGSNAPVAVFSSTIVRPSANIAGMSNDPKRIVVSGYDEVANVYLERFGVSTVRQKWVGRLIDGLPAGGGRVLDLGCGAGIPVARDLAALGHAGEARCVIVMAAKISQV